MVESRRHQNWRVYQLPDRRGRELETQLKCLQDCVRENQLFQADLKRLRIVNAAAHEIARQCCASDSGKRTRQSEVCCQVETPET
jgi:hypothetical protein